MAGTGVTEPPPRRRVARSITLNPWTVLTALFFAAIALYYIWTAATTTEMMHFDKEGSGYYGLMADTLRHGRLALRIQPPQALLDLPNPYDPSANLQFRVTGLHDLCFRNESLYAYWGATAAIVLFAPFQLIGIEIPQSFAIALFGFLGFLFSAMTLRFLARRFLPDTPRWALAAGTIFLALGNGMPFVLRRPAVYEVAVACGLCFAMLGLWLLVTGWFGPKPSWRRLAGASLCFGLALMSRPTLGALAIVPLGLVLVAWRHAAWPKGVTGRQALVALAVPFVACGLLLAAYNAARFGSPTEFGLKYQLSGVDPADLKKFDPAFIPSGLFLYLFAPPRPIALFPFVELSPSSLPWATPDGFDYTEATGGALILAPILFWILQLPLVARRMVPHLRWLLFGLLGAGVATVLVMSFILAGTTQRYAIDFLALLSLTALLIWLVTLTQAERGSWRRRLVAGSGLLVLAWGSALGLALGFTGYDFSNSRVSHHPKLFYQLQDVFAPISTLETQIAGRAVIGMISASEGLVPGKMTWGSLGDGNGGSFYVAPGPRTVVTVVAPRSGTYRLRGVMGPGDGAVAGAVPMLVISHSGEPDHTEKVGARQTIDVALKLKAGVSRLGWSAVARQMSSPRLIAVRGLTIAGPDG